MKLSFSVALAVLHGLAAPTVDGPDLERPEESSAGRAGLDCGLQVGRGFLVLLPARALGQCGW